jgi:hypothetical protein
MAALDNTALKSLQNAHLPSVNAAFLSAFALSYLRSPIL